MTDLPRSPETALGGEGGQGGVRDHGIRGRERKETLSCLSGKCGEVSQGWGGRGRMDTTRDPMLSPSAGRAARARRGCAVDKGWV